MEPLQRRPIRRLLGREGPRGQGEERDEWHTSVSDLALVSPVVTDSMDRVSGSGFSALGALKGTQTSWEGVRRPSSLGGWRETGPMTVRRSLREGERSREECSRFVQNRGLCGRENAKVRRKDAGGAARPVQRLPVAVFTLKIDTTPRRVI